MPAPTRLRIDRSRSTSSWPAMPTFTLSWRKRYSHSAQEARRNLNPLAEVMAVLY